MAKKRTTKKRRKKRPEKKAAAKAAATSAAVTRKPRRKKAATTRKPAAEARINEETFTAHFKPRLPAEAAGAETMLNEVGLVPLLKTAGGGWVVEGTRAQIEHLTETAVKEQQVPRNVNRACGFAVRRSFQGLASTEQPPLDSSRLGRFIFPVPFDYYQAPSAYPPRVAYYHLHPSRDLAPLFGVEPLHARGIRGQGIRVVMIDSGFYRHPYYADPGIHGGTVPQITTHAVLPHSDPNTDDVGHGTGIAANTLAIAPECDFHHVKDDGDPLAAMVIARSLQPRVITCSWGWSEAYVHNIFANFPNSGVAEYLRDLQAEIAAAIQEGSTVLFAAGNGNAPGAWPSSAPGVISVGGALVDQNLELLASSYATSFVSMVTPGRVCPDVCGLVGPAPSGLLFTLPTQPNNHFDQQFSAADGTQPGDGWLIGSGTSSATPQLAGVAALLLQMHGNLTAGQVLVRFREMAVGVHQGHSATGHPATPARPNAATGYGWVTFRRPHLLHRYAFV